MDSFCRVLQPILIYCSVSIAFHLFLVNEDSIVCYNLIFTGDTRSLSPERSPILMRDVKWLTHNCTVGFLVAGMWNNRFYSGQNVKIITCNRAAGNDMLASGDSEGHIRLFRYPCISPRSEYYETKVYSGVIGCVRFLYGDNTLVSVGGTDASLMIWEVTAE